MSSYAKGRRAEYELDDILTKEGYTEIVHTTISRGKADIICWGPSQPLTAIEVKYVGRGGRAGFSVSQIFDKLLSISDPEGGKLKRQLRIKRYKRGWKIVGL